MNDHNSAIQADAGAWAEVEYLGNRALVKVRATDATLDAIAAAHPTWFRFPRPPGGLDTRMNQLTGAQRTALNNQALNAGYTQAEIDALGFTGATTLRQVGQFLLGKRKKVRFDTPTDAFVFDGAEQVPITFAALDAQV